MTIDDSLAIQRKTFKRGIAMKNRKEQGDPSFAYRTIYEGVALHGAKRKAGDLDPWTCCSVVST